MEKNCATANIKVLRNAGYRSRDHTSYAKHYAYRTTVLPWPCTKQTGEKTTLSGNPAILRTRGEGPLQCADMCAPAHEIGKWEFGVDER